MGKITARHTESGILPVVARIVWKCFALLLSSLVLWLLVVSSAIAQTEAGSTESLKVPGVNARFVGEPFTVTVEGVDDGAHRLYVYGGTGEHCPIEHITEPNQETNPKKWLSSGHENVFWMVLSGSVITVW